MKRKNKKLMGTMLALGVASAAGAVAAYKMKKNCEEDIINNFDEYADGNYKQETSKFSIKNIIKNIKDELSGEEEETLEFQCPYERTMLYRRDRVYKKPQMGIKGQKGIY